MATAENSGCAPVRATTTEPDTTPLASDAAFTAAEAELSELVAAAAAGSGTPESEAIAAQAESLDCSLLKAIPASLRQASIIMRRALAADFGDTVQQSDLHQAAMKRVANFLDAAASEAFRRDGDVAEGMLHLRTGLGALFDLSTQADDKPVRACSIWFMVRALIDHLARLQAALDTGATAQAGASW